MEYLIDTDICVFFLRGQFSLNSIITNVGIENCFISEITILELEYGAELSGHYQEHFKEIEKIKTLFQLIPINEIYNEYAQEKVRLKESGKLIPDFDILIGVSSISNGMKMVTNNEKHLDRLNGIEILNWTKPQNNKFL